MTWTKTAAHYKLQAVLVSWAGAGSRGEASWTLDPQDTEIFIKKVALCHHYGASNDLENEV